MQDHGNVDKWLQNGILNKEDLKIENIPFKETNMYVRKIIKTYEENYRTPTRRYVTFK